MTRHGSLWALLGPSVVKTGYLEIKLLRVTKQENGCACVSATAFANAQSLACWGEKKGSLSSLAMLTPRKELRKSCSGLLCPEPPTDDSKTIPSELVAK